MVLCSAWPCGVGWHWQSSTAELCFPCTLPGPYLCNSVTRTACTGHEGGGGGSGPSNNGCPSLTAVTANSPMDWRTNVINAWDPSSSTGLVNVSLFFHNGAHWSGSVGGGGGGAGGHAIGGRGGPGKPVNFDGTGAVFYGAGGGGAGGGAGGTNTGGNGNPSGNAVAETGSGGGGRHDGSYDSGRGGSGVVMIRFSTDRE